MRLLMLLFVALFTNPLLQAEELSQQELQSFTGKILRNKVRLRLQPNLESKILREYSKDDLILVTADAGEFYAVKPPEDLKGYVFRTFVLDNIVEGNRVNIRLEPDTEAAVIGQLNKETQVSGIISSSNSKWLEITLPEDIRFYISKEYIENVGDAAWITQVRQRLQEVNLLLTEAQSLGQQEIVKPFVQINLDLVYARLNKILNQFSDFPEQAAKAKELLLSLQEAYLQKKMSYLEEKAKNLSHQEQTPKEVVAYKATPKMAAWIPVEALLYEAWSRQNGNGSIEEFYATQRQDSIILSGVIQPYMRSVRNKPGDYILLSKASRLPSAYLYSTEIDLEKNVGQEVTLIAVPRPNYNFAFPAYYVLAIE